MGLGAPQESVSTFWKRDTSVSPARIRILDRPARNFVTILTELCWHPYVKLYSINYRQESETILTSSDALSSHGAQTNALYVRKK
jgi:hypothetical protein